MSHELNRFSKDILDNPQCITESKFKEIAEVLESRNEGLYEAAVTASKNYEEQDQRIENGVASLDLFGPLTYRPTMFSALCGGASYQGLLQQAKALASNDEVKLVLMNVDGPGGSAYRMMETSKELRSIFRGSGKKLIAYVDGLSASATYGLTVAADEVIINPDAEAGSIGVVVRLTNTNKRDKDEGVETTYITAGKSKVPFDENGDFKQEFKNDIQERVNELYENFVEHVATARGISPDVVRSTEAKVFSADKALELGLVDKVMEGPEFYDYLASLVEDVPSNLGGASAADNQTGVIKMSNETEKATEELAHEATQAVEATTENVVVEAAESVEVVEQASAEVVEAVTEATVEQPQAAEVNAEVEALKAQLAEAMSAQTELSQMKADAEAALVAKNKAEFATEASAWAFAGVDAEAFSEAALSGSVPVEMFQQALAKAQETLQASDAMKELGATVENEPEAKEQVDGVEAALAANDKVKFNK